MDLSQEQWTEKLVQDDNAIIMDVRTPHEIAEGYIPNAVHLDIMNGAAFIEKAKDLDTSKNYYVYCRVGARSGQACAILKSLGFVTAYNLMGGFSNWKGETTL